MRNNQPHASVSFFKRLPVAAIREENLGIAERGMERPKREDNAVTILGLHQQMIRQNFYARLFAEFHSRCPQNLIEQHHFK